jgi:hypothetical protein
VNVEPSPTTRRVVFGSAVYDVLVTAPFATPWTADAVVSVTRSLHQTLGLGGEVPPLFAPTHLLFVSLFGIMTTLWAVVRLVRPTRFHGTIDTVGRALFSLWMGVALAGGASHLIAGFLLGELAWMFALAGVLLATRRTPVAPAAETH